MDTVKIARMVRVICVFSACKVIRVHEYYGFEDNPDEIGHMYRCTSCGRGTVRQDPPPVDAEEPQKQ